MEVIIIEDEPAIARNLAYTLQKIDSNIKIKASLESVEEAVEWFKTEVNSYDLAFMDIRLADGLSFDIFKQVEILKPVIFLTAYNDYAIQAFKNNGIDYILKPFDEAEVEQALNKFKKWGFTFTESVNDLIVDKLLEQISNNKAISYRKSFLVHYRDKLIPVESIKIAWFYKSNELVYAETSDNHQYNIEHTLEQLEQQLEPDLFFRANRQFIVNKKSIIEVEYYFNGRLLIKIKPEAPDMILISKARTNVFKKWMDK